MHGLLFCHVAHLARKFWLLPFTTATFIVTTEYGEYFVLLVGFSGDDCSRFSKCPELQNCNGNGLCVSNQTGNTTCRFVSLCITYFWLLMMFK